jgi:uncharacterized protein YecT (DUF1311 family)
MNGAQWDVMGLPRVALVGVCVLIASGVARGAEDCDARYFGVVGAADLGGARACYERQENWAMVTVMRLNGEGGPMDVKGARASFERLVRRQGASLDADAQALRAILIKREANAAGPRIDFCAEVAQTTASVDGCLARKDRKEAGDARAVVVKVRGGLTATQQALLEKVEAEEIRLVEADGQRLYQQYVEGTVRGAAALQQRMIVRRHFLGRLDQWVKKREQAPAVAQPLGVVERQLSAAYQQNLKDYEQAYTPRAGDTAEVGRTHRAYVSDYRLKVRNVQRCWIRYRDAWARLLPALYPALPAAPIEAAIKALLTVDRTDEVKSDPFDARPD